MWAADGAAECGGVRGQRDLSASEGFCCFQKQATMAFFFVIIYCNSGHAHTARDCRSADPAVFPS